MFQSTKNGLTAGGSEARKPWQDPSLCRPASPEERASLFNEFHTSAFRLENLDAYAVESERAEYQAYLAGDESKKTGNKKWADYIYDHSQQGKVFERIHVIPRELTDYLRYEIDWGYRYSAAAGERIFFAYRDDLPLNIAAQHLPDFWLFDESSCLIQRYDDGGAWLRSDILESAEGVAFLKSLRDEIKEVSFPMHAHPHVRG
jgi:hypothetical protein